MANKECDSLLREILKHDKRMYKNMLIDFSALETRADEIDYSLDKIDNRLSNIEKELDK